MRTPAARPPDPAATTRDRFSEEAATFTVKGRDTPDLDAGIAAIRNVLRTLPPRPGVYTIIDKLPSKVLQCF